MENSILKNLKDSYFELFNKKRVFIISFIFFLVLFILSKVYTKINEFFQINSIPNKFLLYIRASIKCEKIRNGAKYKE